MDIIIYYVGIPIGIAFILFLGGSIIFIPFAASFKKDSKMYKRGMHVEKVLEWLAENKIVGAFLLSFACISFLLRIFGVISLN
jgi:hypothetical protein